uniref:Uncharacterized protein n=1 Tax=Arundo donax TaxID=35708 RepID=A0A0A9CS43_ARUDO
MPINAMQSPIKGVIRYLGSQLRLMHLDKGFIQMQHEEINDSCHHFMQLRLGQSKQMSLILLHFTLASEISQALNTS